MDPRRRGEETKQKKTLDGMNLEELEEYVVSNLQRLGELLSEAAKLTAKSEISITEETKSRKSLESRVDKAINQLNKKLNSFEQTGINMQSRIAKLEKIVNNAITA